MDTAPLHNYGAELRSRDPVTLIVTVACLFLAALLATANPVRRARSIDPMAALRNGN
jgi:ABC-type lipoprotein release transport system permease subunit